MKPGRPSGTYTQAARMMRLYRELWSRDGETLDALARDLGVTTRTVRRDLDALTEAGCAIERVNGRIMIARRTVVEDPVVRAVARHLRAEILRSANEGAPDVALDTLAAIVAGIERGEIRLAAAGGAP